MPKLFTGKRVIFPPEKQQKFIQDGLAKLRLSRLSLARFLDVSPRTIFDWQREKFSMPLSAVRRLSHKAGMEIPDGVDVRKRFWYALKGAKAGGLAAYKKYGVVGGDTERRKRKWREWWERRGKFNPPSPITIPRPIKKPNKSTDLAEFVGIVMGDGGISRWQLTITLHDTDDKEYGCFVAKLIKKLFGVAPSIYHYPKSSVNDIVVSRIALVKFCTEELGLKAGNKIKQQVDIPTWVKRNRKFKVACLRGLVDTDGSVFIHRYKVNGKSYSYKKLAFTSLSKPLRLSVCRILRGIGLNPRLSREKDVRIDSVKDMQEYFRVVGSHNPKHLRRYLN